MLDQVNTNSLTIYRVCIVNESGQRVFDTIVKPLDNTVNIKAGLKTQIFKYAQMVAPTLEEVQKKILEITKGKDVVGYSIQNKFDALGLLSQKLLEDHKDNFKLIDVAKIFNKTHNDPQWKIADLCSSHLNLCYKKKSSQPFTVRLIRLTKYFK
jgi:DNA polymerase III epsilon subunit-like protein